jgi:hypothetical protein
VTAGLETSIQAVGSGESVAWFPMVFERVLPHPSGRIWAGVDRYHLYLFALDGNA